MIFEGSEEENKKQKTEEGGNAILPVVVLEKTKTEEGDRDMNIGKYEKERTVVELEKNGARLRIFM